MSGQRRSEPHSMTNMPAWERRLARTGSSAWSVLGIGLTIWLAWMAVAPILSRIAPALVTALLVAAIIEPAASRLEKRGVRRGVTAASLGGLTLGLIGATTAFLAPRATSVSGKVIERIPDLMEELSTALERWENTNPAAALIDIEGTIGSIAISIPDLAGAAGTAAYLTASIIAGIVAGAYLSNDVPHLPPLLGAAGGRRRMMLLAAQRTFSAYVRGQLILSLFVGVSTGISAAAIGVPRPALIGAVAGVTNLVPLLGPIVGGAVGALIALTIGQGLWQAFALVAAVVVIQQVESALLAPRIHGAELKVRPTIILLVLAVAGAAGGVALMAIALPSVVSVREAYRAVSTAAGAKDATGRDGGTEDAERPEA